MKKMHSLLIILVTLVSFVCITQAMANQCGSGAVCDNEGAKCEWDAGIKGVCTQVVKDGPGNIPDFCYCRRAQLSLLTIGILPDIQGLTLQEAYQIQAELNQLQDDVDDHIMDLESVPNLRPVLTK